MVNVNQRLAVLKPLLEIRTGRGALQLPVLPHPQLFRIELKYPKNRWVKTGTPVTAGAHGFNKSVLPGLKYYNPWLEIDVQTFPKSPSLLTLHFQGHDPEQLRAIAKPGKKAAELESRDPSETPNYRDGKAPRPCAADDQVTLKETPGDSSNTQPLYQRSVTLPLRNQRTYFILDWLRTRTGGKRPQMSHADYTEKWQMAKRREEIAEEQAASKKVQDAINNDKRMLEKAKQIAEQNATEAAAL